MLDRLIAMSLILAEKFYAEEQNTLELYSLMTGIPIKELAELEVKMMIHMDYHLMVK